MVLSAKKMSVLYAPHTVKRQVSKLLLLIEINLSLLAMDFKFYTKFSIENLGRVLEGFKYCRYVGGGYKSLPGMYHRCPPSITEHDIKHETKFRGFIMPLRSLGKCDVSVTVGNMDEGIFHFHPRGICCIHHRCHTVLYSSVDFLLGYPFMTRTDTVLLFYLRKGTCSVKNSVFMYRQPFLRGVACVV